MLWFKIVLVSVLGLGSMFSFIDVGKGTYKLERKQSTSIMGAILQTFLTIGVLIWL